MTLLAILFWIHLIGMSVWVGASLLMPLVVGPALQGVEAPARMQSMAAISKRLTPIVFVSIVLVFASGIWQTVIRYGGFGIFMTPHPLTIKVWIAVLMFANGTYLGIFLPRRIAAAAPAPGTPPSPQFLKLQRSLAGHSWAQFVMAVVVLLLVGILTG
ncbi:MAG: hypothetical protein FJ030_09610 [Chloroflexi bacterium]|nr:hypothetical protein [Chloroflexota bacterium]